MCTFYADTVKMYCALFLCNVVVLFTKLYTLIYSVLQITNPRTSNGYGGICLLVRSDYYIKMLKFTSLSSILASIIYPINLRLRMLYVSQEVNLNGSLSRLKTWNKLNCKKNIYFL